jgi:hypothetical protein
MKSVTVTGRRLDTTDSAEHWDRHQLNSVISSELHLRILLAQVQTILRRISPKQKPPVRVMHLASDTLTVLEL